MSSWRPDQYLLFEQERTRPCRDLVSRLRLDRPRTVVDLGCGPGNSTAVLAERWPSATITGLDSSHEMLERARRSGPQHSWIQGEIGTWAETATREYDLVFSNAALQWVPDHPTVYPRLLARAAAGGLLAVQVPSNLDSPAHQVMRALASAAKWRSRFPQAGVRNWFVHDSAVYYDVLQPVAAHIDLWETTYLHVMPGVEAITEWYKGTGIRPFLDALSNDSDREAFLSDYTEALRSEYPLRQGGNVLFPFRRLFLVATR